MADPLITSPANPRLKTVLALRRRRAREATRQTLVEGFEELRLALAGGRVPRTLYVCPELFSPSGYAGRPATGGQPDLVDAARTAGASVVRLSRAAFEKVAYREGPDGLLGILDSVDGRLEQLTVPASALLLVIEGVEKPGNLGAMLRTADAAGADAVLGVDLVTDWGNPNVVRASKGTVCTVPLAAAGVDETVMWCRAHGIRLVVTTPDAPLLYTDVDYTGSVAVAVGAEKHGASATLLDTADARVRIPLAGRGDSLNVGAAAAVVLYEAVRQRSV